MIPYWANNSSLPNYSQLSSCGHLAVTNALLLRTLSKSPAKTIINSIAIATALRTLYAVPNKHFCFFLFPLQRTPGKYFSQKIQHDSKFIFLFMQGLSNLDNWGGGLIFIYSCACTIKAIDFKRNYLCRILIYEYQPHQLSSLLRPCYTVTYYYCFCRISGSTYNTDLN